MAHFRKLSWRTLCFGLLLGMIWPNTEANSQTGAPISQDTKSGYSKSNQSKVFYHDGKWLAMAFNNPDSRWYIWKYSGGVWSKNVDLDKSTSYKFDAMLNGATNKLYVIGSHTSSTKFWRFTYSSGAASWTKDAGFNVNPSFNNSDGTNPVSMIQAKNGDLWLFRIETGKLQAKRSTDGGLTWSSVIDVKTGLTVSSGSTDAVAFSAGSEALSSGNDYIGVVYGEPSAAGSKYGFLLHRDGDPNTVWTDESASLTFFGNERADNKISAATDINNNVFVFTQNANISGSEPNNTLYKRSPTAGGSAGPWSKFAVNTNVSGLNWKTPAVVADISNNALYVMGVNTTTLFAEYKSCTIGAEATLADATPTVLLSSPGAAFDDLSAPAPNISALNGMMVCGDNRTANDIWHNQIALAPLQTTMTVTGVTVSSSEANKNSSYTISFNLGTDGELVANAGTITVRFPDNTRVVPGMPANQILVNGAAANTATSNKTTHEVIVTTPVSLSPNANVTLVFNAAAQLLNPSNAGNYALEVFTSKKPAPAVSPSYAISAATTKVSPAIITPSPAAASAASAYTIAFSLGPHGRLISGSSTITLTFNSATGVANGNLTGAQVNGVEATAIGNSASRTVAITVPAALILNNNAAVTIKLPALAIMNPSNAGDYTLTVATSVENTLVPSNPYTIQFVGTVSVGVIALSTNEANATSSYTVPLT
ncbi:MAG: hypothetical protein ACRENG_14555, partial [bacterium]